MSWTAPMTAVANDIFTAAQFNTHVRDNLLETAPGKATAGVADGSYFVKSGTNSIVDRQVGVAEVDTSQTTTSTSFTDLATAGPTVTVTTGTRALVIITANLTNNTDSAYAIMGVTISGASSVSASDANSLSFRQSATGGGPQDPQMSWSKIYTGLTAGSNTFTSKYRVTAGTGTFQRRRLSVIPF